MSKNEDCSRLHGFIDIILILVLNIYIDSPLKERLVKIRRENR